jgi:hypothetical protein
MRPLLLAFAFVLIPTAEVWAQAGEILAVPWNDWRVWSVAAAFFGFTFGTLIKFGFDLWLDWIRKCKERKVVAIEIQADMVALRIHALEAENYLQDRVSNKLSMKVGQLVTFEPPRRVFLHAAGGRFGLLGFDVCSEIVTALARVTRIRRRFAVWQLRGADHTVKSHKLPVHVEDFRQLAKGCDGAIHSLGKITHRTFPGTD